MKMRLVTVALLVLFAPAVAFAGGSRETVDDGVVRVALIGNQRFGDGGPMDSMADGLQRAIDKYGVQGRRLESISPGGYEEDIRAMAREGYDLIITTFPPMSPAMIAVARDFPDTKFAGVYQFINVDGVSIPNIWDTEFQGQDTLYTTGVYSAIVSQSGRIGIMGGFEEPFINNEVNGFLDGVRDVRPDAQVDVAFVGSFEDPAQAKEIALAMISRGVDVIQTLAARSQLGALEAAQEAGIVFIGDVADNRTVYPDGFAGYYGVDFGANVVEAVRQVVENDWQGGQKGVMSTETGGYYFPVDVFEEFAARPTKWQSGAREALEKALEVDARIKRGEFSVPFRTHTPSWR